MEAIASRYAESLFDLAKEENQIEEYAKDMKLLLTLFNEDKTLVPFFTHVLVEDNAKLEIIDTCFKSQIQEYVCNFLKLLVKKKRIRYIKQICQSFNSLYNDYFGIEEGILYTSFDISEKEVMRIQEVIGKKENKKVKLEVIKDTDLVGGIKVVLNNRVFDGSIKNQLELMKSDLLRK
ncbi:MAG: F0F1 ATP synthase subunit delta [Coprobacillaceae bacterium]